MTIQRHGKNKLRIVPWNSFISKSPEESKWRLTGDEKEMMKFRKTESPKKQQSLHKENSEQESNAEVLEIKGVAEKNSYMMRINGHRLTLKNFIFENFCICRQSVVF